MLKKYKILKEETCIEKKINNNLKEISQRIDLQDKKT